MSLAVVLALLAGLLFAVASVLQQRGTTGVAEEDALGAGMVATLARSRVWLAGMGADIGGFVAQAAALGVGSLLVVQPLLVSTLLFALPLAAFSERRRLRGAEWAWAAVLSVSLVVFMVLGEPEPGRDGAPLAEWVPVLVVTMPVVAICVVAGANRHRGTVRSLLLAVAAGTLLGLAGPLIKTTVAAFDGGFWDIVTTWELWAMAVFSAVGTFLQQSSYQAGDVQTSLPAVTVLKPVVAMALGVTLYQESLRVDRVGDVVLLVSLGVMAVATVGLGRLAAPSVAGADQVGDAEVSPDAPEEV